QELNPSFYLTLCRQLLFELAETSNEMVSLKLDALEESRQELPTEHQAAKINMLADQGIAYFERFLRSFDRPDGTVPDKYPSDAVRPIVLAHFYIGRLQGKKMTADPREKLVNLAYALEHYRWIVKYCEVTDPLCQESVKDELDACRDMANLLPLKMARVQELIKT
uniref:KIF-binding protein n=2 Tax=Plectus sambesii TaxID=2011161 RepID=A0A914WH77_9BILA